MTDITHEPLIDPLDERWGVRHHPIRGFLWGLVAGIGLALVLVVLKVISLSIVAVAVTVGVVVVLAILWGVFGPPRDPSGPVPVPVITTGAPPPSRFDDFDPPSESADTGVADIEIPPDDD